VCQKDDSPKQLLCCELCPAVYHTYCLEPPLPRVPRGDWYCKACTDKLRLQDVEKVLAERWLNADGSGAPARC
jgi:hypothetical protein